MSDMKIIVIILTVMAAGVGFVDLEQRNVTAEPGHDVSLSCRAQHDKRVDVVEWTRPDLETEYVLLCRDGHLNPEKQHPSFQNRVDLQDRQMKDGDVSLILKDARTDDAGTYECRVFQTGTDRRKRAVLDSDPVCSIRLEVSPAGGDEDGGDEGEGDKEGRHLDAGHKQGGDEDEGDAAVGDSDEENYWFVARLAPVILVVAVLMGVGGVGFMFCRRHSGSPPPPEATSGQQQGQISVISLPECQNSDCPSISCP